MRTLMENIRKKLVILNPILPYGVMESWDDLNPRLYHAIHVYWLKFYGLWYYDFSPKSILFWIQLLYTLTVLWFVCFFPCFGEIVYLLKRRENVADIAEGLYLFLSEMYTYFKVAVFWLNKEKVRRLLKYLLCDEFKPVEPEHREIILRSIKLARNLMTVYSLLCIGAVSVAIIMPLNEHLEVLPTNVEYPHIDVYRSRAYHTLYIHHIYYKPATCIIDGALDTMLAAFVISSIGQIEILAFNLRNFDKLAQRRTHRTMAKNVGDILYAQNQIREVFRECIKHHNCIVRYVSMIEDAFSLASALQFMLSAMVLCLVGIQFLSIENPASHALQIMWMAIYLTCMLLEVFILCWFGNELIWKSTDLLQAAFDGPWMDVDRKSSIYIVIFLERCKRPLRVTAGKILTLSLDTYTILINWSYKAFAVIRNMKK